MVARLFVIALAIQAAQRPVLFSVALFARRDAWETAVVQTSLYIRHPVAPEAAPNHVALFAKLARDGAYARTIFHRVVRYGVIQGGDPFTRDPAKTASYGQGGFNQLKAEPSAEKHTAGAISTVRDPSLPDSGGSQFFISVTDQPDLDGQYDVFGRVVDGIEVVQQISAVEADAEGLPKARVEITGVTIRDTPPEPFVKDTPADLASYRAFVETTMGTIELEMLPTLAPETVRRFLRWADAGIYDGIKVHRVARNFVVQTGALAFRERPLSARQNQLVQNLPPEFSDTPNVPGTVSIARGTDPGSGSTSFFVCIGQCRALDRQYTVFAKVVGGWTWSTDRSGRRRRRSAQDAYRDDACGLRKVVRAPTDTRRPCGISWPPSSSSACRSRTMALSTARGVGD
jgi:cyclophilin family peptidyl-prolyl cis-trans isomerase